MADEDENVPDYLKDKFFENDDNFGPEDVAWTGEKCKLDPDRLLRQKGREPTSHLVFVLRAMIRGHSPEVGDQEVAKRVRTALGAITGQNQSGRPPVDDNDALLQIAWRFHVARHEKLSGNQVELRPIVRSVVEELFSSVPAERNISHDSYIEKLEEKFSNDKDLLLSRATMDDDWNRLDDTKKLKKALTILSELGVPVNLDAARPLRLRKNSRGTRDETQSN